MRVLLRAQLDLRIARGGDAALVRSRRLFRCGQTCVGRSQDMIARLVSGRGLAGQAQDFPKFEPCVDRTLTPRYVLDLMPVVSACVVGPTLPSLKWY